MEPLTLGAEVLTTFPLFMHKVFRDFAPDTGGHALNRTQMKVLMIVHIHVTPNMTEVCRHVNMERGSMTSVVNELIALDLIRRSRNPDDRRKVDLSLTGEGRGLVTRILELAHRHLEEKLEPLEPAEVERFKRAIHDLHAVAVKL